MTQPVIHTLTDLVETAADLLGSLGEVHGIRAILSPRSSSPVRLLVKDGQSYTLEVGNLDLIAAAIGGEVTNTHHRLGGQAVAKGQWNGTPVEGSHLYFHQPLPQGDVEVCTDTATRTGRRLSELSDWAAQPWVRFVESVHVFDVSGAPRVHVVLVSGPETELEDPAAELMKATGQLQHASRSELADAAYGCVLSPDGTVFTISSIHP